MDCQSAVENLFEKLCSWQEDSQRQFSEIINSHRGIIRKELNDLDEEMIELKGQLEVIENERKVLLETVDNLNCEIKQLNTKLIPVISDQEIIDDERKEGKARDTDVVSQLRCRLLVAMQCFLVCDCWRPSKNVSNEIINSH